jgi:hypothetical protein
MSGLLDILEIPGVDQVGDMPRPGSGHDLVPFFAADVKLRFRPALAYVQTFGHRDKINMARVAVGLPADTTVPGYC